ncbi:MAG: hypothetical protein Kow0013_01040 [Pararhodobacter sp.]
MDNLVEGGARLAPCVSCRRVIRQACHCEKVDSPARFAALSRIPGRLREPVFNLARVGCK